MTKTAARFQISDVALRKRCLKHHIPMPGRGYWRKIETGGRHKPITLPKRAHGPSIVFDIELHLPEKERVSIVDQAFLDYETAHPIIVEAELASI